MQFHQLANRSARAVVQLIPGFRSQKSFVVASVAEECGSLVVDPGQPAGHAGAEVDAGCAEDNGKAAGHVFAAMIANAFDDREGAGVADCEALASASCREERAAGCAVE